jgi:hypothetical protein
MYRVWAVTWRPGNRSASFLNNLFRPLGSPVMMVQASHPQDDGREAIGLLGISARIDPKDATAHYDDVRLRHDFHRVPFVGARGPILDPSDDGVGRGNGSWLKLALEVDRIRSRAAVRNFLLPSIPSLPRIYFGFSRKEAAKFEVTSGLRARAAAGMDASWTISSLGELGEAVNDAKASAFESLSEEQQQVRLLDAWNAGFTPPDAAGNSTGLWLVPHELCTDAYSCVRIFECFDDLVGAPLSNPARRLSATTVPNPAIEVAKEAGVDLVADLASIAGTQEGSPELLAVEARLISLVPAFRERVSASTAIDDQALLCALCDYERPVTIEPSLTSLSEGEQLLVMRANLTEHVSQCCTDQDLLFAIQNPNAPLFASGLCRVQTLRRNVQTPLRDSLSFSSIELQQDRVHAKLWQDRWPDNGKCSAAKDVLQAA